MLQLLWIRLRSAVTRWPSLSGWGFSTIVAVIGAAILYVFSTATGIAAWRPSGDNPLFLAISALFVPALGEELFFRGVLVPSRGESGRALIWIGLSLGTFVLWHVIEALAIGPSASLFLNPAFLAAAAILGFVCTALRYWTGSVWPAVLFHAAVVWGWQLWLGGPQFRDLMPA